MKNRKRPLVDVKCLELAEHFLEFEKVAGVSAEELEDEKWDLAELFQEAGESVGIRLEEERENRHE